MADIFIHPHASVCLRGGSMFSVAQVGLLHPTLPPPPPALLCRKVGKRPRPPNYSTVPYDSYMYTSLYAVCIIYVFIHTGYSFIHQLDSLFLQLHLSLAAHYNFVTSQ
jgi:hypothetical protein